MLKIVGLCFDIPNTTAYVHLIALFISVFYSIIDLIFITLLLRGEFVMNNRPPCLLYKSHVYVYIQKESSCHEKNRK